MIKLINFVLNNSESETIYDQSFITSIDLSYNRVIRYGVTKDKKYCFVMIDDYKIYYKRIFNYRFYGKEGDVIFVVKFTSSVYRVEIVFNNSTGKQKLYMYES